MGKIYIESRSNPEVKIEGNDQSVPALRAARTELPAVAEMPTHSFVQPATRLKP